MEDRTTQRKKFVARLRQGGWASAAAGALLFGAAASGDWHATRVLAGGSPGSAAPLARTIGAGVDSYAAIVDEVSPAVVTIRAERRSRAPRQFPFADDPAFRRFFGERENAPAPPAGRQAALGSGVVVRSDGYILTNHHVIDGAEEITVEFADRRAAPATVVGTDAPSDLAVLKVDAAALQPLPLADSAAVRVGDVVLALGNPMGVGQTVTMGIISATGRATGLGDGSFEDFLQTDAPINSGNSGGALVNTRGELVGINSQILSPSGGNIGIGFAIPASMARNVMDQLIEGGTVRRGRLGVTAQTVDSAIATSLGLDEVRGALVSDIARGSAGERAGLRRGDVILAVDGRPIADSNALRNRIAATTPGSEVKLELVRDGREQTVSATLEELPGGSAPARDEQEVERSAFGLRVEPLNRDRARELGVRAEAGLVVAAVVPDSPAASAGLRPGDVIETVDGKAVSTAGELKAALSATPDRPALVLVHRKDQTLFVTLARS